MSKVGIIMDLEGTLISNGIEMPGSVELLKYLKVNDIAYRIITNTVSKSLKDLSNKFLDIGIVIPESCFINPIVVLSRFLTESHIESFYFVGPDEIKRTLNIDSAYQDFPEYVILCDFENINCNYELLNKVFTFVHKGSKILTMSNSEYYLAKNGPKLDTGAFSRMFESITHTESVLFGKPSQMIYNEASKQMGLGNNKIIAIGDDIFTDIKGANDIGAYSILVKTGKYNQGDENRIKPDQVIDSLFDFIPLLKNYRRM